MLRQYALVKFDYNSVPPALVAEYKKIFNGDTFIYLGEIPNMPGHGVLIRNSDGKLFSGYHIDEFYELSEDEV